MTQIEIRVLEVFNSIVEDIMYLWDNVPREIAEKSALVFIQNPDHLHDLNHLVSKKRKGEG
tara:strand:- start:960 stop:1142 length:183 start_codon:yes stop_codon:yes gene_type:complete